VRPSPPDRVILVGTSGSPEKLVAHFRAAGRISVARQPARFLYRVSHTRYDALVLDLRPGSGFDWGLAALVANEAPPVALILRVPVAPASVWRQTLRRLMNPVTWVRGESPVTPAQFHRLPRLSSASPAALAQLTELARFFQPASETIGPLESRLRSWELPSGITVTLVSALAGDRRAVSTPDAPPLSPEARQSWEILHHLRSRRPAHRLPPELFSTRMIYVPLFLRRKPVAVLAVARPRAWSACMRRIVASLLRSVFEARLEIAAASLDPLTAAGNRRKLQTDLPYWVEGAPCVGLALVDLHGLGRINARRGYEAGDRCLQAFARLVGRALEGYGSLYRFGGDEFVAVIRAASCQQSRRLWEEALRAARRDPTAGPSVTGARCAFYCLPHPSTRAIREMLHRGVARVFR